MLSDFLKKFAKIFSWLMFYLFNQSAKIYFIKIISPECRYKKNSYSVVLFKNNFQKLFISFILIAAVLTACNKPQSFEYRGMQNLKVDSVGLTKSKISLELVYFNPNNFGVNLRNVNCDVYVNHNYLGKYVLDTLMLIAKKSEFAIPSSMAVDMKNIYKNSLNALLSKQVLVELRGSTRVGKSGIFITVPFNYSAMETFSVF